MSVNSPEETMKMQARTASRESTLLLVTAWVCFIGAVVLGIFVPLLTAALSPIIYGLAFAIAGVVLLVVRTRASG